MEQSEDFGQHDDLQTLTPELFHQLDRWQQKFSERRFRVLKRDREPRDRQHLLQVARSSYVLGLAGVQPFLYFPGVALGLLLALGHEHPAAVVACGLGLLALLVLLVAPLRHRKRIRACFDALGVPEDRRSQYQHWRDGS